MTMVKTVVRRDCLAGYDEGTLKAFVDGELSAAWHETLRDHVRNCRACGERLRQLRLDGALVHARLRLLDADADPRSAVGATHASPLPTGYADDPTGDEHAARPPVEAVLALAKVPVASGERWGGLAAWWRGIVARGWRPAPLAAGAAAAAVLLVGAAVTQPVVQSFAQGVLQSFRVQRVQPVQIDPAALRALPVANLEELFAAGTYSGPKGPAVRASTVADAAKATGVALRAPAKLPAPLQGAPAVYASDPMSFSFTYDGQKLVDLAQKHGVTDPVLLAELRAAHGVTVRGTIPAAALLLYGEPLAAPPAGAAAPAAAKPAARHERTGPFLAYFQMRSPSLDVPKDLNVDRLRELALRSGAVPPQVANQLLAIADWKTTLPVPVTRGSAREVPVDGITGVLVTGEGPNPALIWLKDGVLNVMSAGSEHDLLEAARALAPAR